MAVSHTHPDASKDASGCYKRGDLVVVMEDGHPWGRGEGLPTFVRVKIPGVPASRVRRYLAEDLVTDQFTGQPTRRRRRLWRLLVDDVPNAIRRALRDAGEVTVTWEQVRGYVRDKVEQREADALGAG